MNTDEKELNRTPALGASGFSHVSTSKADSHDIYKIPEQYSLKLLKSSKTRLSDDL